MRSSARRSSPIARCSPTSLSRHARHRAHRARDRDGRRRRSSRSLFVQSRWIEMSLFPYAVLLQVTPIVAIAPLIIIWVQDTRRRARAVRGRRRDLPDHLQHDARAAQRRPRACSTSSGCAARAAGRCCVRLRVPSALPYFFGGLRIASGLALIGAVVAEFVAGTGGQGAGLAYQILLAGMQLNIPRLFAALFLIAATGVALFAATVLAVARRALALARERARRGLGVHRTRGAACARLADRVEQRRPARARRTARPRPSKMKNGTPCTPMRRARTSAPRRRRAARRSRASRAPRPRRAPASPARRASSSRSPMKRPSMKCARNSRSTSASATMPGCCCAHAISRCASSVFGCRVDVVEREVEAARLRRRPARAR